MSEPFYFLRGGGEMGALIRQFDWVETSVGAPENWPQTLRTAISLLLGAKQPVYVAWGPELLSFYNDGYLPIIGTKHPGLGQPFSVLWSEIWDQFKPIVEATMAGEAQHFVDLPIALAGRPGLPEGYFTFSYTALRDEDGSAVGFYCAATETTRQVLADRADRAEREQITKLLAQAPSFMCVLRGPDHVFEYLNDSYLQLVSHRDLVGLRVADAIPEAAEQGFIALLDKVYRTGEAFIGRGLEIWLEPSPGARPQQAFLNFVYQPIINDAGVVTGIFVEGSDITDTKRAEFSLRDSELRARMALDAAEMGVWDATISDGAFSDLSGDARALSLLGGTAGQPADFKTFSSRVHPADAGLFREAASNLLNAGTDTLDVTYRIVAHGEQPERWVKAVARKVTAGDVQRLIGTVHDVTAQQESVARQKILTAELQHRIKNILAMVSAIASQSLRGETVEEARGAFNGRLDALAHAHDVLIATAWRGSTLQTVLKNSLSMHLGENSRIDFSGPDVVLNAKQALSLSLGLHELATNAAKYGSLSGDTGEVSIRWTVDHQDDEYGAAFRLAWQESGGPEVAVPSRQGFGSRLLTRVLPADFNGRVSIDYAREGVSFVLTSPISGLQANALAEDRPTERAYLD